MKTEERTRVIEEKFVVYISDDGKEFDSYSKCSKYEEEQRQREFIKLAEEKRIKQLDGIVPLTTNGEFFSENSQFRWYRVENESDFETIKEAYVANFKKPEIYPDIICIEEDCYDENYVYSLRDCKKNTEEFWNFFNAKVTFSKEV